MKKLLPLITLVFIISIALAGCGPKDVTLEIYAGDALRAPLEELKVSYEAQNPHVTINYNFGASKVIAGTIHAIKQGDGVVMASNVTNALEEEGLLLNNYLVVTQKVALAIKKDSTVVSSWDDLSKEGVRIVLLNPDMGLVGSLIQKTISASPQAEAIRANVMMYVPDLTEALELISNGEADVTPILRGSISEEFSIIALPDDISVEIPLSSGALIYTSAKEEAVSFAEFVASEEGRAFFLDLGFGKIEE